MRALALCTAILLMASGCDRRMGVSVASDDPSTSNALTAADNTPSPGLDADNTGINARDRSQAAPTPLDQGQGQEDINITATIRRRVVEQPLSLNAHNVKIITQEGKVTLRGPVKTSEEKAQIAKIANEVAGAENVSDLLDVERD